ncbi:MAG: exosome complex exonuclease Rrp41 [Candidatus Micrarchaeota archaeon]|nr:exosome complex exonuclease Rrp41 [Candidatus Micrarchaeota archaeon]
MAQNVSSVKLIDGDRRLDGRGVTDLRSLKITAGVLKKAGGSALVEWGKNKVLAGVYGPREVFPKHMTDPYKAIINCKYSMASFSSLEDHGRAGPNRRAIEIGKVAKHVFENNIFTNLFPKTMVNISMEVLQSDGGTRIAGITAASVAVVDAGIPVKDLVQGVSVGKIGGRLVVDLDKIEDNMGQSDIPVIVSLRSKEVLLYQLDGMLTRDDINEGMDLVFEAAKLVREKQVQALKEKYERVEEQVADEKPAAGKETEEVM